MSIRFSGPSGKEAVVKELQEKVAKVEERKKVRLLSPDEFLAEKKSRDENMPKIVTSIRVDMDILDYFKKQGSGYQKRMHAVLREYVDRKTG
jgi:uncharacterized protein (DUF4415 family)